MRDMQSVEYQQQQLQNQGLTATTTAAPGFDPRKFVASSTAPREEEDYD